MKKRTRRRMGFKRQKNQKNSLLSDKLIYTGTSELKTQMQLIQFNADHVEVLSLNSIEELAAKRRKDYTCWLNVYGLSDTKLITDIQRYFSLHVLEMQDIMNADHIPKAEEYENNILLIMKALFVTEEHEIGKEQLSFVLGSNFLLTFQETDRVYFDNIKQALQEKTGSVRKHSIDYLFSLLLRDVCDSYDFLIEQVSDALEDLETELMHLSKNTNDIGWEIQTLRKQYMLLKKTVQPLKESFSRVVHGNISLFKSYDPAYLNDTYDHLLMVSQKIDICRETIASLLDLYISNNDLKMNEIMKQLTIVGTIFIPLTFVVGVWGMNFRNMPELEWEYGYIAAWIIMIVIGIGGWLLFKLKKWY